MGEQRQVIEAEGCMERGSQTQCSMGGRGGGKGWRKDGVKDGVVGEGPSRWRMAAFLP
jgi:hypothetical protein